MFRRRPAGDFAREIQAHIDLEAERLVADGVDPAEARRLARRVFGNVTLARERYYESRRVPWLDHLVQDARTAARSLTRYPVACAVAVLSLAGGIGATTATLIVRDTVFYRPPPLYQDPAQLSTIDVGRPERPRGAVPAALYDAWAGAADLRPGLAAAGRSTMTDLRVGDRLATVPVRPVTPELFAILGVSPSLGRAFSTAAPSGERIPAILSYHVWQTVFDGRSDALGRDIWIANQPVTIVGVMPERFWFTDMESPIWLPLDLRTIAPDEGLAVVMRRPGRVTPPDLQPRLQRDVALYAERLPPNQRRLRAQVWGIGGTPLGTQVSIMVPWMLGGAVLLTLLIACANVAILAIAQWTSREQEIAIRASLGASSVRIVRLLLTESVLLAALGGLLGVCATFVLRGLIVGQATTIARFFDFSIDPKVLVESALVTILTGLVAGLGPALVETRRLHGNPLRAMASTDRVRQRWRHGLVVMEIAVTVGLLVVAAALVDGYRQSFFKDLGFDTHRLVTARVENRAGVAPLALLDTLSQMPGVAAVGAASAVPFDGGTTQSVATDAGASYAVSARRVQAGFGFFAALDVPMRTGRSFTSEETSRGADVAIINETLAGRLFGARAPGDRRLPADVIGRFVFLDGRPHRVVGVVADYSVSPMGRVQPGVFVPLAERRADARRMQFVIRAAGDPGPLTAVVRRQLLAGPPGTVVTAAFRLDDVIAAGAREILMSTFPLMPLIATGMLLTAAGIYGVLSFAITRRSRELAVRVAIGATNGDVIRLVAAHSLRIVAMGTVAGVGVTFALTRVARATGGAGSIWDPTWRAFVVPMAIILVIGALATWLPSRRALKIDPALLLRSP
jgi:predicted permease